MTKAEYGEKRLALISHYLTVASEKQATKDECADLAWLLADALDRLALEIDPFENITKKKEVR